MGIWDCHCAICAATVSSPWYCKIGSCSESSLERRGEFIRRERRKFELGDHTGYGENFKGFGEDDGEDEEESEPKGAEEENVEEDNGGEDMEDDDDASSDASGDERINTYDPDLVSKDRLQWLEPPFCIGINPNAPGPSKGFISGPGAAGEFGDFEATIGDDPNQPGLDVPLQCYGQPVEPYLIVFPFHWCCLEILAQALTGSSDTAKLDKDAVYKVMEELNNGRSILSLNYGQITGCGQDWKSVAGEEYTVTNPVDIPGLDEFLHQQLLTAFQKTSKDKESLQDAKVINDPFSTLPYDILHTIIGFLPGKSIQELMKASWSVHCATISDGTWKRLMRLHMPWFWELHEIIQRLQESANLDYKKVYLWLEKATSPTFGMRGQFLGVANRRRIWGSCQQLGDSYFKKVAVKKSASSGLESAT